MLKAKSKQGRVYDKPRNVEMECWDILTFL